MHGLLDDRVGGHIRDLFAAVVDGAVVAERFDVLLGSAETHVAEDVLAGRLPWANTLGRAILAARAFPCRRQRNRPRTRGACCVSCSVLQLPVSLLAFLPEGSAAGAFRQVAAAKRLWLLILPGLGRCAWLARGGPYSGPNHQRFIA